MSNISEQVIEAAIVHLEQEPAGLRFQDLARRICASDPSLNVNTVKTMTSSLHERYGDLVYKPSRGLFRHTKFRESERDACGHDVLPAGSPEDHVADAFANWLVSELGQSTTAVALNSDHFGPDWSTPRVIAKRELNQSDIIHTSVEIMLLKLPAAIIWPWHLERLAPTFCLVTDLI